MTEEAPEVEREEYGDLAEGQSSSQYQEAANDLTVKPHCGTDSCTAQQEEPAEAAWVKLMSAVPQATQINNIRAAREGTMMLPEGKTIQSMVSSIRPQPEADYALDTIRDEWTDFYEEFRIVGPKLEQGLVALSSAWKGEDYDGFEEQLETVIANCRTIQNDIGGEDGADGVIKLLDTKQIEIFEQQGGTACAYPAPKFYMEGTSCGSHRIHIRPPFFKSCVIEENDEIKHAVEMAGFDPTVVDEVQEGRQRTYDRWIEYLNNNPDYEENGLKGEALAQSKADEYADQELVAMGAQGSEQLEEEASIINEDVTERHSNVEAQVTEIEPDAGQGEPTTFEEGMTDMPGSGGLDTGGGGGMPDIGGGGGLDGMTGPTDLKDIGSGPGGLGSGGPGSGGLTPSQYPGGSGPGGLGEENPFSSGLEDPDNLGGQPPGDLTGVNPGGGGLPPSQYPGSGLGDLDPANPWDPANPPDPEDVSGGLASGGGPLGGTGAPPSGIGGGGGLGGGGLGGGPIGIGGGGGGLVPSTRRGGKNPINAGTGANRPAGTTSRGLGGSSGSLGRGSGGGLGAGGGSGSGAGGGRGGGGLGGAGRGGLGGGAAGRGGMGATGVVPAGGAGGKGPGEDEDRERKVWMTEEEEVWGGSPEDDDDDPYA
ncbi:hypothetical protein [Glycomyces tenuis]|uniref:hypothetical protein n=1 Tax=Glycomyces tenuis TaxID=58116 RepID=UPI00042275E5|nr:hypothetical protein [Glycomyces tenuis]